MWPADAPCLPTRRWPRGVQDGCMERILQTEHFGPHRVDVIEYVEEEGPTYAVMIDDAMVTPSPLSEAPPLEEIVRIYAQWQESTGQK